MAYAVGAASIRQSIGSADETLERLLNFGVTLHQFSAVVCLRRGYVEPLDERRCVVRCGEAACDGA